MKQLSFALLAFTMLSTPVLAQTTDGQTLDTDRSTLKTDKQAVHSDYQQLRTDENAGNAAAVTTDQSTIAAAKTAVGTEKTQYKDRSNHRPHRRQVRATQTDQTNINSG